MNSFYRHCLSGMLALVLSVAAVAAICATLAAADNDSSEKENPSSIIDAKLREAAEAFLSEEDKKELQGLALKERPPRERSLAVAEENFERRFIPVFNALSVPLGVLPEDWVDASAPGSEVFYSALYENAYEGNASLRMQVKSAGRGAAEVRFKSVPLKEGQVLRIKLSLRSDQNSPVRFGLKSSAADGPVYLEQPVHAPMKWGTGQLIFQVTRNDPNAVFYFALDKPGQLEIDSLAVLLFRPREGNPVPALGESSNLLTTSSFPSGIHTPWVFLDGNYAETDYEEFGPTGIPALSMTGLGGSLQAPFKGKGYGTYTFSLYLKGTRPDQPVSLMVMPPTGSSMVFPYNQRVFIDPDWRRYSTSVPLNIDPDGFYLVRIVSQSEDPLWVDGLQVETGEDPGPFQRAAPVELVGRPLNPCGVFLEGDPLIVQVTAYGALSPTRKILGKLYDYTGKSYALKPLIVDGSNLIQRTLVLKDLGEPAFGPFRLELQAFNLEDEAVSPVYETFLIRVRVPRLVNEYCPDSPFGIILGKDLDTAERVGVARALGFKWVSDHEHFSWNRLESSQGIWKFDQADQWLSVYERYRMGVLASIGPSPRWAVEQPEDFPLELPLIPRNPETWESAVKTISSHFSGKIQAWQPWPKPFNERTLSAIRLKFELAENDEDTDNSENREASSNGRNSGKQKMQKVITPVISPPQEYVALQKVAHRYILENDPEAIVVAPLEISSNRFFSDQVISRGIESSAGVFGFEDGYLDGIPFDRVRENVAWIEDNTENSLPVWQLRANSRKRIIKNAYLHYPPEIGDEDSEYITDETNPMLLYGLEALNSGVDRLFYPAFPVDAFSNIFQYNYRIFNIDGRLNPEAAALSNMMWMLEGKGRLQKEIISDDLTVYLAADKHEAVAVFVVTTDKAVFIKQELPDRLEWIGQYGNPVNVTVLKPGKPVYLLASGFSARQLLFFLKSLEIEPVADEPAAKETIDE